MQNWEQTWKLVCRIYLSYRAILDMDPWWLCPQLTGAIKKQNGCHEWQHYSRIDRGVIYVIKDKSLRSWFHSKNVWKVEIWLSWWLQPSISGIKQGNMLCLILFCYRLGLRLFTCTKWGKLKLTVICWLKLFKIYLKTNIKCNFVGKCVFQCYTWSVFF